MQGVLAEFEWLREPEGYRIVPLGSLNLNVPWKSPGDDDVPWITPHRFGNAHKYQPFAKGGDLCSVFARIYTPEQLLRFVNNYGLLNWSGTNFAGQSPFGEPVTLGLGSAEMFRELLHFRAAGNVTELASHFQSKISGFVGGGQTGHVEILPDPKKGVRLKITVYTLLGALWLQLAFKLSEATLRLCPVCQRVFEVGRGTKRRADAQFCCHKHKVDYFNRKRTSR